MIPNQTIVDFTWVMILVGFAILGLIGALMYYADRKPSKKSKK